MNTNLELAPIRNNQKQPKQTNTTAIPNDVASVKSE